jgi:hypothetical protein
LAAKKLNDAWDGWAAALSQSHEKTLRLLEAGKKAEAHSEFRERFLATVREVYSEAAVVSPERFSKSKNWNAWLRHLYALSVTAEKALRTGVLSSEKPSENTASRDEAISTLEKLRAHFYELRFETDTQKSNDYLYAFHRETMKEHPEASQLKVLFAALEKAVPSLRMKDNPEMYQKAKDDWAKQIAPIVVDDTVAPSEIEPLRAATCLFYRAYGMQIE